MKKHKTVGEYTPASDGKREKCENCGRLYSDFYKGPRPIENCPHCGIRREEE